MRLFDFVKPDLEDAIPGREYMPGRGARGLEAVSEDASPIGSSLNLICSISITESSSRSAASMDASPGEETATAAELRGVTSSVNRARTDGCRARDEGGWRPPPCVEFLNMLLCEFSLMSEDRGGTPVR